MRKAIIGAPALIAVALSVWFTAGAAARTTVHFKIRLVGAQVSSTENVYDVRGPIRGAAIQRVKENSKGTGGTSTATAYYGVGTSVSVDKFTNSLPNAKGIVTIHTSGRIVRGTGLYRHVSGKYTGSGTLNTKNGQLRLVLVGTETY